MGGTSMGSGSAISLEDRVLRNRGERDIAHASHDGGCGGVRFHHLPTAKR